MNTPIYDFVRKYKEAHISRLHMPGHKGQAFLGCEDMDITEIKAYVPYAVKFNADNVKTGMVPGDVEMCNGVSLYIADKKDTADLVAELFSTEDEANSYENNVEANDISNK